MCVCACVCVHVQVHVTAMHRTATPMLYSSFSFYYLPLSLPPVLTPLPIPLSLLQLDQAKKTCFLTDTGRHLVLASLLAELLFVHGEQCYNVDTDLPRLFQQYFSIPLPLSPLKVDSPAALLAIPEIHNVVQVWCMCVYWIVFCLPVCLPC